MNDSSASILGICALFVALATAAPASARAEDFDTTGRVAPANGYVAISAGISGIIASINFDIGSHVHKGDELLRIRCTELEAALRAAEARGAAALAVATRVRNGPRAEEIKVAEANVGFATAKSDEADSAFKRAQTLSEGVSISKAVYLQAQRDARLAAAQLEEARAQLALLRAGSRAEDIAAEDARAQAAAADADLARAQLNECVVRAPVDGVIVARLVSQGQYVSTALSQTLLRLADDRELIIRAQIEAPRATDLCPNQTGTIIVGASRKQFYEAKLEPFGLEADASGMSAVLRTDGRLTPELLGAPVKVHFASCGS